MLSGVGAQFRSSEAYEAARKQGFDYSERTLRSDLHALESIGMLKRTGNDQWQKMTGHTAPVDLRVRIALALIAAGYWERLNTTLPYETETVFRGPSPEKLTEKVNEYASLIRSWE
jgi:hypothetical protein